MNVSDLKARLKATPGVVTSTDYIDRLELRFDSEPLTFEEAHFAIARVADQGLWAVERLEWRWVDTVCVVALHLLRPRTLGGKGVMLLPGAVSEEVPGARGSRPLTVQQPVLVKEQVPVQVQYQLPVQELKNSKSNGERVRHIGAEVETVFEHWVSCFLRPPGTKLTSKRRIVIEAALAWVGLDGCVAAISMARANPKLIRGRSADLDLPTILRTPKRVKALMRGIAEVPDDTWLTPYEVDYKAVLPLGQFPFGVAAKVFKPLEVKHGPALVRAEFRAYLAQSAGMVSLPFFATNFGTWQRKVRPGQRHDPSMIPSDAPTTATSF